jgi:GTPase Era involved in 16S rRNA processing
MIGDTYFASRDGLLRLADEIFDFAATLGASEQEVHNTAISPEYDTSTKSGIQQTLLRPFTILACGEVNSGKSSLLNAIIGEDLCRVHELPQTGQVHHLIYHTRDHAINSVDGIKLCPHTAEKLRFIELIEAPGTDATQQLTHATAKKMIAMADAVLVLFPVTNPWGAPTWDFVTRYSAEVLEKTTFILQQCDKKSPADLPVLLGHLRDLSMKRLGRVPPLFPIAAKLANESRQSHRDRSFLQKSGLPALEQHLERQLLASPSRRAALKMVRIALLDRLHRIEDRIEARSRQLLMDEQVLAEIEKEIEQMRIETIRNQSHSLGGVGEMFQKEAGHAAFILKKRLSLPKCLVRLFTGEDTAYAVEALIQPQLLKALADATGHDFQSLVLSCCNHWLLLTNRIKNSIGAETQALALTRQRLEQSAEDFVSRMAKASVRATNHLRLRGTLDAALRVHHHSMRVILGLTLFFTTIAGVCGGLHLDFPAIIFLAIACGLFCYLGSLMIRNRNEIVQEFGSRLASHRDSFVDSMRGDYEEGMRLFYKDYNHCLDSVRSHLVRKKQALQPQIKKWNDLFLALKALEQDLIE